MDKIELDKVVDATKLTGGLPIEYKMLIICFCVLLLIGLLILKNKFIPKSIISKSLSRKAFLQLSPKQSFQVINYRGKEYILLVSQDSLSLINQEEKKEKERNYLELVENL